MNSNKAINLLDNPSPALRASSPTRGEGNGVQGFTLIELLVVVLIIGILAAVAVPQYQKAVLKARVAQVLPFLKAIYTAQQLYFLDNGKYAEDMEDLNIQVRCPTGWVCSMGYDVSGVALNKAEATPVDNRYFDNFRIILYYGPSKILENIQGKPYCMAHKGKVNSVNVCKTFGTKFSDDSNWVRYFIQ